MNSHDWKTPLVQFRLNDNLMAFWQSEDAKRLRDLIGIKPDKFQGMINGSRKGNVTILCTPTQFAYIACEYHKHRPNFFIKSLRPKLKMPPRAEPEFDIVHSSSCWFPDGGDD